MLISSGMKDLLALAVCRPEKQPGKQKKNKNPAVSCQPLIQLFPSPSPLPLFSLFFFFLLLRRPPLSCSVSLFFQCMPGYVGTNCSDEINECFSQPCQNGGTCIDLINTYKCSCPRGTQGQQTPRTLPRTAPSSPPHLHASLIRA